MFSRKFNDQMLAIVAAFLVSSVAVGSAVLPGTAALHSNDSEIVTYA
ncbi:hypothetical protein ABDK56_10540 [Sphingomonas sp. ASV193]